MLGGDFAGLTDALGGVTVDNEHASESWNVDHTQKYTFPVGPVELSGEKALSYVRDRKHLPEGDLDRASRQREVLAAILAKMASPDVLANPARFSQVVGTLGQYLTVDSGLTNDEVFRTASSMRVGRGDIVSLQAPITGFGRSAGGQSINLVDWPKMKQLATHLRDDTMDQYPR